MTELASEILQFCSCACILCILCFCLVVVALVLKRPSRLQPFCVHSQSLVDLFLASSHITHQKGNSLVCACYAVALAVRFFTPLRLVYNATGVTWVGRVVGPFCSLRSQQREPTPRCGRARMQGAHKDSAPSLLAGGVGWSGFCCVGATVTHSVPFLHHCPQN
jgi:hypothetical protein